MSNSLGDGSVSGDVELQYLSGRPCGPRGPLSSFYVELRAWDEVGGFAGRLRSLVLGGVKVARKADFETDELPESDIPPWAVEHWQDGATRYSLHREGGGWTIQDFLYSFDPVWRTWSWWDVTLLAGNIVQVWVDSGGEPVFNCDELRWAFYVCGARTVVGPVLQPAAEWEREPSVGLD